MRCGLLTFSSILYLSLSLTAQRDTNVYSSFTTTASRTRLYAGITRSISNLSKPLTDSTEDLWQNAFGSMELLLHTSPWENNRILYAFDSIDRRSLPFQRSFLELIYTNYPTQFVKQVNALAMKSSNEKIFAMCVEYLLRDTTGNTNRVTLSSLLKNKFSRLDHPILKSLLWRLDSMDINPKNKYLADLLRKDYLPGNTIVYSFQRKNRDYPGLAIVRDGNGNITRNDDQTIFSVPQLARSISNLPGYLTDGSTPQGIFRMLGFDVSRNSFIGPTPNIQLTMPGELSPQQFLKDSTLTDTAWTEKRYSSLLPPSLIPYFPLYGSYYAGMAGRTEIIAHGTTVDPTYYHSKIYFPFTPTEGCLCTKEIWNPLDGRRIESGQQQLVNAIKKVGGPDGYYIVIELDDAQRPVTIQDVLNIASIK